jgi:predicted permease
MVDTHLIIHIVPDHVKPDTIDSFILMLAYVSVVMALFSTGVSVLFLIDYFKRHSWQYKRRVKKTNEPRVDDTRI